MPYIHPVCNRLATKSVKLLTTPKQSLRQVAGQEKQESSALQQQLEGAGAGGAQPALGCGDLSSTAHSQIQCRWQRCVGEMKLIAALQILPCKHLKQETVPALWRHRS